MYNIVEGDNVNNCKIVNLSIIYEDIEKYGGITIITQPIIVTKKLSKYEEISSGIKFKPILVDEDFFKKFHNQSTGSIINARNEYGMVYPGFNESRFTIYKTFRELHMHDVIREKIKEDGFVFFINKSKNDLNNLKGATSEDIAGYLDNIYSTKFYEIFNKYNPENQKNAYEQRKR